MRAWIAGPLVVFALLPAPASAPAATGLLHKAEVCTDDGGYASLGSVAVMAGGSEVLAVDRSGATPVVRRFTDTGRPSAPFTPAGFPADSTWGSNGGSTIILERGPPGTVFVLDRYDFGRLYHVSAAGQLLRDLRWGTDTAGPQGLRYNSLTGALASITRELFLLDAGALKVFDMDSGRSLWSDPLDDDDPRGHSATALAVTHGAIAVAMAHHDGSPDRISVFRRGDKRLQYALKIDIPGFVQDIANNPDHTIWVLANHDLYRYDVSGRQLDHVETGERGATAIDSAPDGSVWVTTSDGLLHIGAGGDPIPTLNLRNPCGPPRVSTSYDRSQPLLRTGRLALRVRCSEDCTIRATGRMGVPTGGRQFLLRPKTYRLPGGSRRKIKVKLPARALRALRRSLARGEPSSLFVNLQATDAGGNQRSTSKSLTLG